MSDRSHVHPASALVLLLAVTFFYAPAAAEVLLVETFGAGDGCDSAECLEVSGGQFAGDGWVVTGPQSRIVLALQEPLACGSVEVELSHLDPIGSGHTGEYTNFIGLYEGDHGNNWEAARLDQAQLQVAANCDRCEGLAIPEAWRDERLKFKGLACSWDFPECGGFPDGNRYLPEQGAPGIDWQATLETRWTATIEWGCAGPRYGLRGDGRELSAQAEWSYHEGHPDPRPHLRFLFLGRDHAGAQGTYLDGLIIHRVTVAAMTCDCCQCAAGATETRPCGDCGAQSRSCNDSCTWSSWEQCTGPDPGGDCATGQPGECAAGTPRCIAGQLRCEPLQQPAVESCGDGRDEDCDGEVDEGCGREGEGEEVPDGGAGVAPDVSDVGRGGDVGRSEGEVEGEGEDEGEDEGEGTGTCTAGDLQRCTCNDGRGSVQECTAGAWAACECPADQGGSEAAAAGVNEDVAGGCSCGVGAGRSTGEGLLLLLLALAWTRRPPPG